MQVRMRNGYSTTIKDGWRHESTVEVTLTDAEVAAGGDPTATHDKYAKIADDAARVEVARRTAVDDAAKKATVIE